MEANSDQDPEPLIHPQELTPPGWSFQREHLRLMRFIIYVTQMASQIDEGVKIAAKALYDEEPDRYQEVVKRVEEQGATRAPCLPNVVRRSFGTVPSYWHGFIVATILDHAQSSPALTDNPLCCQSLVLRILNRQSPGTVYAMLKSRPRELKRAGDYHFRITGMELTAEVRPAPSHGVPLVRMCTTWKRNVSEKGR